MLIKDVYLTQLYDALRAVNKEFAGNITFKRIDFANGKSRTRFNVTLTVKDSSGPGARRGYSGRRVNAACWHVYGTFLDNLPEDARAYMPTVVYENGRRVMKRRFKAPGDEWEDWNIGSEWRPLYYSEACDCDGG